MSSNDGLNLVALLAGTRTLVDAIDAALEFWHALPLEVGMRTYESTWGLGVNVMRPHPDDPNAYPALEVDVTVGPWCVWVETTRRGDGLRPDLDVLDLDEDPLGHAPVPVSMATLLAGARGDGPAVGDLLRGRTS